MMISGVLGDRRVLIHFNLSARARAPLHVPETPLGSLLASLLVAWISPAGWEDRGLRGPDQSSLGFYRGLSMIGFLAFCPWVCRIV